MLTMCSGGMPSLYRLGRPGIWVAVGLGAAVGERVGVAVATAADVAVGVGVIASKVGSAVAWASTVASTSGDGSDAFPYPAIARKGTTIAANDAENLGLARIMGSAIVTFEPSGGPRRYARPAERAGP